MATLLATIGAAGAGASALTTAATAVSTIGTIAGALGARSAGKAQQAQLEAEAKQAEAISQQEALKRRREGEILASRQRAVAAAQGGAADPSVLRLLGETAAETERAAQTEIYRGKTQASGARYRGAVARAQGRASATGQLLGGAGKLLGQAASAYDRFNTGGNAPTGPAQNRYRYG